MKRLLTALLLLLASALPTRIAAQLTGPQQLSLSALTTTNSLGQFNAVQSDAAGNIYLLLDQRDGLRILKLDPTATTILAQVHLGAQGDTGLALALDPSGNVYAAGTSSSGTLSGSGSVSYPAPADTTTNSFLARFDSNLTEQFLTFCGSGRTAVSALTVTADAAFLTGSTFTNTLPVTPSAIQQTPAPLSTQNGFVERFTLTGQLTYATYLTGYNGTTAPAAIAADSSDNAYIAGYTTSTGYPTINALIPEALTNSTGFLTKLNPDASGILFSTFLPGNGITGLALTGSSLYLTGNLDPGGFPIATVTAPIASLDYQSLLQLSLDGSTVLASTLLAPSTSTTLAANSAGAWVTGDLDLPLLPLTPLSDIGDSFALHITPTNQIDQTLRLGAAPTSNPAYTQIPSTISAIALDPNSNPILAGSLTASISNSLLTTQRFDAPLTPPTAALPNTLRNAIPTTCAQGTCTASAAWLTRLTTGANAPSLILSTDDLPNLTLRNLGTAQATNVQLSVSGYAVSSDCPAALAPAAGCSIVLTGSGPGSITVSASNASSVTYALPATTIAPNPIAFFPHQLDFGIVTSTAPVTRTITVTNLTAQPQTFPSSLDTNARTLPYTLTQSSTDCTLAGPQLLQLAASSSCHITLALSASSTSTNDGPVLADWLLGTRDLHLTAITQAATLTLSAATLNFGTQYQGGLRLPRYLYLSNASTTAIPHAAASLPASSPFTIADNCPSALPPSSVCQLRVDYLSPTPSADSITLTLDNDLTALLTGTTLAQPGTTGASVNPSLSVSPATITFANPVAVTAISSNTQAVTVRNTGITPFPLNLTLTGDFTSATSCGPTLAGGAACSIVLTFAPSQPGPRTGLLGITAGSGTSPAYIALTGTATPVLPANNGTLDLGSIPSGAYTVEWYKVAQPFTTLTAATTSPDFTVALVEDLGYGYGTLPTSAFATTATGTCANCWLAVQFHSTTPGAEAATLALTSPGGGNPYTLTLTGAVLAPAGLLLTPLTQDFGPIPIHSTSAAAVFQLTNLASQSSLTITPTLTGDFALSTQSTGADCTATTLAYTASCLIAVDFAPTAPGTRTGTLTLTAGASTITASLTGYATADPGLAFNPAALTFSNVPGPSSTQQTITLTNTGSATLTLATPTIDNPSFTAATTCSTLVPSGFCLLTVTFTPSTGPVAGTLSIPVTATLNGVSATSTYTVPLTGAYTYEDAGLQITPASIDFGATTATSSSTRSFTITNLTAKSLTLALTYPRQFAPASSAGTCAGLAPSASCTVSLTYLPATYADVTGTLFAQATAADNSTYNGLAYLQGYGLGQSALLTVTGPLTPGGALDFGLTASGQSSTRTITLTNTGDAQQNPAGTIHLRRITSEWPFLVTANTCPAALPYNASCTVTVSYTPLNQVSTDSTLFSNADSGALVLESDSAASPQLINLTGSAQAVAVPAPGNTAPIASLTLSQGALTFPTTAPGSASALQTLTLINTGTTTLTITGLTASTSFTLTNNCTAPLVPSASCTVAVAFTPQLTTAAAVSETLEIASTAASALDFVTLSATTTPPPITLAPTSLNFGSLNVNSTSQLPITLTNTGSVPITAITLTTTGDYTAAGNCPVSLAPSTACILTVTFTPTQTGLRTGALSVAGSATTLPLTVPLTGTGTQSQLSVAPTSLSFGSIAVNASANQTLTLTNTGSAAITSLTLTTTGDYAFIVPCTVTTLAPNASCTVTVTFTPTQTGIRPGTLTITSSDPSSPAIIPLTGTGVSSGSFTLTANSTSASVPSGNPGAYTLTATPLNGFTGQVILTCVPVTAAQYTACSLLPGSILLSTGPQSTTVTITTLTQQALTTPPAHTNTLARLTLCLLLPFVLVMKRRRVPTLLALLFSAALLAATGCGSNTNPMNTSLLYTPAGTYQYQVTATTTSGPQITQTLTLTLTVQ